MIARAFTTCAALALSTAALAHDDHPSAAANQVVVRDAETGALRAPTAEEADVLQRKAARAATTRRASQQPMSKAHVSGAQGARLTEEFMSYSVAVRQADGRVKMECFNSPEEASAAMKAAANPAAQAPALPTE